MATFHLIVLTPDRIFYSGECESLIFPASDGAFGVKANHSPFVSLVEPGSLKLRKPDGEEILAAVSQGIAPEIVAAISAAIAASEGVGAVSIRSIRVKSPAGRNPWSAAAIAENAKPF